MMARSGRSYATSSFGGLTRGYRILGYGLAGITVLTLIFAMFIKPWVGLLFFIVSAGYCAYQAIALMTARTRVLREKDTPIWGGLARIIAWDPNEGVMFLKNKQLDYVDDNPNDGGGIRIIFPILGEELAARAPLEIQTTPFEDSGILTREFIPVSVKATIFWKIVDLNKFSLLLSRQIHMLNDEGGHAVIAPARNAQLETAERWLCSMMEEKTRAVVSKVGTGLLLSDRLMNDLPAALPSALTNPQLASPESSEGYRSATEGLAEAVASTVGMAVIEYGIEVHRVTLQQVNMPPEIYAAAVDACKSAYAPLKAKADAIAERMRLQAQADVLGVEAAGLKEIAGNVPALALQDFLGPMFLRLSRGAAASV